MNQSMNDRGDCRTALATPGLLKSPHEPRSFRREGREGGGAPMVKPVKSKPFLLSMASFISQNGFLRYEMMTIDYGKYVHRIRLINAMFSCS